MGQRMAYTTLIDTETLASHLDDPDWVIVDCRFTLSDTEAGRRAYAAGHLPGARYAHLDEDLSGPRTGRNGRHPLPDPAEFARTLGRWGIDGNKQVVVYDDSFGSMAVRLWWLMRWMGHDGVALLDGGLPKWQREKRPLTPQPPRITPTVFVPHLRDELRVDAETVLEASRSGSRLILDARPEMRFTGEMEPIDPVAGHVPGAINVPFDDNLDVSGTFLPPEALRAHYEALLAGRRPEEVIVMCGSGVTACHDLLAMEVAGLTGAKLYPGSWSEWITDPRRPVARGE
jgi:thiosulfate/3-mercaptopyruvate sulfurtransferase